MKWGLWLTLLCLWALAISGAAALWIFGDPDSVGVWIFRVLLPGACCDGAWLLYKHRPDRAPRVCDPLNEAVGFYYERDGMCFALKFKKRDGYCWGNLYVQNRYGRAGSLRIQLTPHIDGYDSLEIVDEIECDGGGLVVRRIPLAIPIELRGRRLYYKVIATSHYPKGKGRLIHMRSGAKVVSSLKFDVLPYGCLGALVTAASGVRVMYSTQPVTLIDVVIPRESASTVPDDLPIEHEVLWEPDGPTGGFPVSAVDGGEAAPPM